MIAVPHIMKYVEVKLNEKAGVVPETTPGAAQPKPTPAKVEAKVEA